MKIEHIFWRVVWKTDSGNVLVIPVVLRGKKKIQVAGTWTLETFLKRK